MGGGFPLVMGRRRERERAVTLVDCAGRAQRRQPLAGLAHAKAAWRSACRRSPWHHPMVWVSDCAPAPGPPHFPSPFPASLLAGRVACYPSSH